MKLWYKKLNDQRDVAQYAYSGGMVIVMANTTEEADEVLKKNGIDEIFDNPRWHLIHEAVEVNRKTPCLVDFDYCVEYE